MQSISYSWNNPGGQLIYNGLPQEGRDMIFAEGMAVPGAERYGIVLLRVIGPSLFKRRRSKNSHAKCPEGILPFVLPLTERNT